MRSCKWSLRSHYEKQWGKRALMGGGAAVQYPGSAAVWNRGRTRQLNGSHPPRWHCPSREVEKWRLLQGVSFLGGVQLWHELWQFCGLAFAPLGDWKINKHPLPQPSVLHGGVADVNENTSDRMLFVFVCSCVSVCGCHLWVGVCACMCMHAEKSLECHSSDAVHLGFWDMENTEWLSGQNHYLWLPKSWLKMAIVTWCSSLVWDPQGSVCFFLPTSRILLSPLPPKLG